MLFLGRLFIVFMLLLSSLGELQAQAGKKSTIFVQGEAFLKEKKYANALTKFEEVIGNEEANVDAFYYAAICYLNLGLAEQAFEYLKNIQSGKASHFKEYNYWYAQACYQFSDFSTAQDYINSYLKSSGVKKYQKEAQELSRLCGIGKSAKDNLTQNFVIEGFDDQINSSASESGVLITKDLKRIFFNRQNRDYNLKGEGKTQVKQQNIQLLTSDISKNDSWTKPILQNCAQNDYKICQLIDENKRILVSQQGDLKMLDWTGNEWKSSANLEGVNTLRTESSGFIYAYDSKMILVAETEKGDLDLFFSTLRRDGAWDIPQPIKELNSLADENTPFIVNDGKTLFFSSKGHNSMGGYDIFKSDFDSLTNKWSKPTNLGLPINSIANDWHFSMMGELGFLASDRIGGMGSDDLYRVYAFDKVRMSGKIYNRTSNLIVANCLLKFTIDGKTIEAISEADGSYKIDLPFHKPVEIKVYSGDRIMYEENLKLSINPRRPRFLNRNYYIDDATLPTTGTSPASYLSGEVKDKKTRQMLSAVVKLVDAQTNKVLKTTTTDANGKFNFFLTEKAEKYIVEANSKGYIYGYTETSLESGMPNQKIELALPIIEPNVRFTLRNITFETNSDVLQLSSLVELDKVFDFMNENNQIKVEISGHTDNVGDSNLNMNLSERRAASVVRYLVGKGVASSRITAKGYGATRPVASNDYEKGGKELNRRIEVMIVQ